MLAMDVLPAQASSVSSERVFSSSKLTCTRARNKMAAPTVESLQLIKYYLQHHQPPISHKRPSLSSDSRSQLSPPGDNRPSQSRAPETLDMMTRLSDSDWNDDAILEVEGNDTTSVD